MADISFTEEQFTSTSDILKSIAHPTRLKILCFLIEGERSVGEIEREFGSTISNISQHLTVLRRMDIIKRRKDANFMFYSVKDDKVLTLLGTMKKLFCPLK
ncbi:MAG: ArsR family transcriptional regulator [Spirochaetes bacterium]|nr:MAG: ArsR family transcriptional regulator [Spirochaetota bacterium]